MAHGTHKVIDPITWSSIESSILQQLEFDNPTRLCELVGEYNQMQILACQSSESKFCDSDEADHDFNYHEQAFDDGHFDSGHNNFQMQQNSSQNIQRSGYFPSFQAVERQTSEASASGFKLDSTKAITTSANKMKTNPTSFKKRMKWTQHLHQHFVDCVDRLGGIEKATPREILKIMGSDVLTIFHVKSHLQKYRTSKQVEESKPEKIHKTTTANDATDNKLDRITGMQIITETLQLVNRRLQEQFEMQRKLQLLVEEQGRQIKMIFQNRQKQKTIKMKKQLLNIDQKPYYSPLMNINSPSPSLDDAQHDVSILDDSESTYFH